MKNLMLSMLVMAVAGLAACEQDSGDGSGATKLSECKRMVAAYCDKEQAFCDDLQAVHCPTARQEACEAQYDGTCGASSEVSDSVDHEIDMIISPQTTCEGLRSIDDHMWDAVMAWQSLACDGGGSSTPDTTFSQLCENAAAAVCQKMIDLGCLTLTLTECEQLVFSEEIITLGGTACTLTSPNTAATQAQQDDYDTGLAQVAGFTDCSSFE